MKSSDHYVAQTYLKKFVNEKGDICPYYKKGHIIIGKPKKPKAICFETNGDTNKYFPDPRILDQYLPEFKNTWSENIDKIDSQRLDGDTKYKIAGYIAFLRACTPTAKRLGQESISGVIKPFANKFMKSSLDKNETLSTNTKALLNRVITEDQMVLDVDKEFAHALGIESLVSVLNQLYCSCWLVLKNKTNIPLITSDNPTTLYYPDSKPQFAHIYIPVKTDLAILISPDLSIMQAEHKDVLNYPNENDRFGTIKKNYVKIFNTLVVKGAEDIVLHSSIEEWLEKLVQKYRNWIIESHIVHLQTESGYITMLRQRPVETVN
ncbi:MAG: DUF4238 domain-containing protein [Promethearchaeota archaeon]|jgi:hypothetical protein